MGPRITTSSLLSHPLRHPVCSNCLLALYPRTFTTTTPARTRLRREMYRWINGPGSVFRHPLPNSTNYINAYDKSGGLVRANGEKPSQLRPKKASGDPSSDNGGREGIQEIPRETRDDLMPFPLNRHFRSQSVLSDELREEIWRRIVEGKQDIRAVSVSLGVEMRRVGAVVRLVSLEKRWEGEGKPFANPYAKAVMSMLPQTPYIPTRPKPHETINDLPVHSATTRQIFHPTSESRQFTRTDAGKVFDRGLLPSEKRIPHPELVEIQSWYDEGRHKDEVAAMQRTKIAEEEQVKKEKERVRAARKKVLVKRVETPRWEFRFQDISIDTVGTTGRNSKGVGARYGMPHEDRKKGQIKIPTRVE